MISVAGTQLEVAIADRPAFWTSGLAEVESIEPLEGLLFVFPEPVDAAFTNQGMMFGLDVSFFHSEGGFMNTVTMPACPHGPCDAFRADRSFLYALEVPFGSVAEFHVGEVLDPG
jgi:uncharacterized membrane protein (UPF0127 family)